MFVYKLSGCEFPVAVTQISDIAPVSSREFLDIQATAECRFNLKCVYDMIKTDSAHSAVQSIKNKFVNK